MKSIQFKARLLDTENKSVKGRGIDLQIFLVSGGWTTFGQAKSNAQGRVSKKISFNVSTSYVPEARMTISASRPTQLLSGTPTISISNDILILDFGNLTVHKNTPIRLNLNRDELVVGGQNIFNATSHLATAEREVVAGSLPVATVTDSIKVDLNPSVLKDEITFITSKKIAVETELAAKNSQLTQLQTQHDLTKKKVVELEAENAHLAKAQLNNALPVKNLTSTISSAVTSAQLNEEWKISNARVKLKGTLAEDGNAFRPLGAAEIKQSHGDNLAELSFDINPTPASTIPSVVIPDLIGMTLDNAYKIATAIGLSIQTIDLPNTGKPQGAIVEQFPVAGSTIEQTANSQITVLVST